MAARAGEGVGMQDEGRAADSGADRVVGTNVVAAAAPRRPVGGRRLTMLLIGAGVLVPACGTESTTSPASEPASASTTTVAAPDTAAAGTTTSTAREPATTTVPAPSAPGGRRNPGDRYGEYGIYERVSFAPGSSESTLSAGVAPGTVNGHLYGAAAGQRMTIVLDGLGAVFDAYGPDDALLADGVSDGAPVVVDPLPADGDYLVVVQSVRGGAGYDLTVEIVSPSRGSGDPSASPPSSCDTYTEFDGDYPLRLCHRGDLVRDVQQALADLGYDIDVDGFFGAGTAAVAAEYFDDGVAEFMPADLEGLFADD